MITITTIADVRTWISNCNLGGVLNDAARMPALVEAIRTADGRPAYGEDWSAWLDENAAQIAEKVMTA